MCKIGMNSTIPAAFAFAVMFLWTAALSAQSAPRLVTTPLPPMGWSSWNSFSNTINSDIAMAQAKAMVSTGMAKAGYQYINIDEGWWLGERDAHGNIVVDPKAWPAIAPGETPGDMANIVRFIHSLGLKAGIYTDAGSDGCSLFPDLGPVYHHTGSEGHYEQDFLQFARWGFDYVKVDWCGGDQEKLDPAVQYAEIARAIARAERISGHRLYFSLCEWGRQSPWTWAANVGGVPADVWRTSDDIVAPIVAGREHSDRKAAFDKMLGNFDQGIHPEAEHTGFYNDPDMMVIGMPGLTGAQNRVHMGLWAISGAPLLVGADLTTLSPETLATLTSRAVLDIDQDPLGLQAIKTAEDSPGLQVWSKPLAKRGERAVLLLNRTAAPASISFRLADLALLDSATARDLWTGNDLGQVNSSYSAKVPAGDAILLLVQGKEAAFTTYKPLSADAPLRGNEVAFTHIAAAHQMARVEITYTNPGKSTRFAELRVNGRIATRVAFPPTGATPAFVAIQSLLDRTGARNELVFSTLSDPGPAIQSIAVQ